MATWRADHELILLVTALFAAAFAMLDVAEPSHQIRVSAMAAVITAIIVVLRATAALLAEQRRAAIS